jgi:hypothetical protein
LWPPVARRGPDPGTHAAFVTPATHPLRTSPTMVRHPRALLSSGSLSEYADHWGEFSSL